MRTSMQLPVCLLLPAEQYALCYPIAARHLCKARIRQCRLLEYLSFIRFAELPTPTLARRWDSRA